ncbi:Bug family tripartite tricarboxylate transporter substrate binding protein [Rhodoplanes sp. Z2-YC6860]|uniref:Bug family tripartite tricarboxylate transporter substrate binding protein n=1 Tax=Rhodoplanes sp. Z2-YC6860 TaxID=674703 RepID=UPI00078C66D0|nr:tripartite tricarboxylate transporter substrate-binding protein [Rhodoplanes sp. Z2-YC6860]AMN44932.1 TTT family tricarboxylate transporter, receptor protein [Rhodoplanes sp. Z2-YC6860]
MRSGLALCGLLMFLAAEQPARAQSAADFYRGRTVTLLVGYSTGGGYDTYARILARHMGRHIPGNPTIVVQNAPGAGSMRAANTLYNVAPKDGSTFGMFGRGIALEPLIGTSPAQFEATKFTWLGSGADEAAVVVIRSEAGIKSWSDMVSKPFTVGGEGTGSDPDVYALMLRNVFGVKLKLVSGYPGTTEMALAIERGEVDGRASWSWSSLKSLKPDWLTQKKIVTPVQLNLAKSADLPDVPLLGEFATTERQRQIMRLVLSRQTMGRPFTAPPGIPADRAAALRAAFDETMQDPEFLAEAKGRGQEVNPVSGAAIDKLLAELYATPKDVTEETKRAISGQ